mmetsp:Transcript_106284/g.188985  ORF Transcript_106284/g.188985 Transcript_106284/m.188985 type:complete len:214 (+) Transcript_106284:27-668(+)
MDAILQPISEVQKHTSRVLELVAHGAEEGNCLASVDEPVVVGQRHVHHRPGHDLSVNDDRPLCNRIGAHARALRVVDHTRAQHAACNASVDNAEGRIRQVLHGKLVPTGFLCEPSDLVFHVPDAHVLRILQGTGYDTPWARNRNADVHIVTPDCLAFPVIDDRVDAWDLCQRQATRLGDHGEHAKLGSVELQERVLVLGPESHGCGHVNFLER